MIKFNYLDDLRHFFEHVLQNSFALKLILFSFMQKLTSILLLISYFNTALAVGIDIHFCGGQIADIKIIGFGHAHCNFPKGSMPKNCCKNEFLFCKSDNHKAPAVTAVIAPGTFIKAPVRLPDYISPLPVIDFEKDNNTIYNHCRFKYKPNYPLFILNEVFLI